MTAPRRDLRGIYSQLASEYGISEGVVRAICGGSAGKLSEGEDFSERVGCMRRKLEMTGLVPVHGISHDKEKMEEFPELRSCVLCEEFLGDDDPGEPVVNGEDGTEGVVCEKCAQHGGGMRF